MNLSYRRSGEFVIVIIKDGSGRTLAKHKCWQGDKRAYTKLLQMLDLKYGFSPEIKKFPPEEKERISPI